jgi:hypothetical protein
LFDDILASNEMDLNCLAPIIENFGEDTSGQPDLFNYACPQPAGFYDQLSQNFASTLCCFSNQNAVLVSINQVYPPCFMNHMANALVPVDATYFCVNGSLYDMGTVEISLNMKFTTGLPNMNDEASTQTLRGTMMGVTGVSGTSAAQITVLKYTYYSDNAQTVEVPTITGAPSGVVTCRVMISSSEISTWAAVAEAMASPTYGMQMCSAYGQDTSMCTSSVIEDDYFTAQPWDLSASPPMFLPNVWVLALIGVAVIFVSV